MGAITKDPRLAKFAKMAEMRVNGCSVNQIAKAFKISRQRVSQIFQTHIGTPLIETGNSVKIRREKQQRDAYENRIDDMLLNGWTRKEIVNLLGISGGLFSKLRRGKKIASLTKARWEKKLIGKRFGRITVGRVQKCNQYWFAYFTCDCGKESKALCANIARGFTKSCGCLVKFVYQNGGGWNWGEKDTIKAMAEV